MRLKQEMRRRRIGEKEFAEISGVSYTWLREILGGKRAGSGAREKIRTALSKCTVCGHEMDVPADEELFAIATRRRKRSTPKD